MNTMSSRRFAFVGLLLVLILSAGTRAATTAPSTRPSPDARYAVGELLYGDDFTDAKLPQWQAELQQGGTVAARGGAMEVDVPAGCTVWFVPPLDSPVLIQYEATVVQKGGPNDRASDLNCFWMATDARSPQDLFATTRSGKFSDYDELRCYYVGLGGNGNTTTRFRRYIGQKDNRPLLPEHDLRAKEDLITPNVAQTIRLIAAGPFIEFWRDGRKLFELNDPEPYTRGHFAFRTVTNHMLIRHFEVRRLELRPTATQPATRP